MAAGQAEGFLRFFDLLHLLLHRITMHCACKWQDTKRWTI